MNLEKYRNNDGTYNGIGAISEITNLSKESLELTIQMLNELIHSGKFTKEEATKRLLEIL